MTSLATIKRIVVKNRYTPTYIYNKAETELALLMICVPRYYICRWN